MRLQQHTAQARVQRQLRQHPPRLGQFPFGVGGPKLGKQLVAVGHRAAQRRLNEVKRLNRTQAQRLHAQNHACQAAAGNFGVGKRGSLGKIGFVVQPNGHAVGHPATASRPLRCGCLTDALNLQLLHFLAVAVALDAGQTAVDHVAYAGHGQRSFGHVGGQHNTPSLMRRKNTILLGLGEARKQGQHLGMPRQWLMRQMAPQVVGGAANLALTRQEHQNIARLLRLLPQLIHRLRNGGVQVGVARFFKRLPLHLNRIQPTRDLQHRRRSPQAGKVVGKALGVNCGRGNHHLKVGSLWQQVLKVPE